MRDIERLHLFPAVFPVSEAAAAKLPEDYGRPGVHTMAAAAAILKGTWRPQVSISMVESGARLLQAVWPSLVAGLSSSGSLAWANAALFTRAKGTAVRHVLSC